MFLAKGSLGFILALFLFSAILTLGSYVSGKILLIGFTALCWLFLLFSLYFFRDPDRQIPDQENLIVSPADGKVIAISEDFEPELFGHKVNRISIFMSVVDVHVNRIPIDGLVTHFSYYRGKFFPAFQDIAATDNEQTVIGIENERCTIVFKQIAGILARRIVCEVRAGHRVVKGERFGLIKFGSRIDVFLPKDIEITVNVSDRVKGGESVIGKINEK
ncbi:phosphatidylserine decarboxylase family protein [candidate division KSB1 bacterium]|nr:phosphatidylserine decarboxylase family protein [candidate division KSB1 bacterium]